MVRPDPQRIVVRMIQRRLARHRKAGRRIDRKKVSAKSALAQRRQIPAPPAHVQPVRLRPRPLRQRHLIPFKRKITQPRLIGHGFPSSLKLSSCDFVLFVDEQL